MRTAIFVGAGMISSALGLELHPVAGIVITLLAAIFTSMDMIEFFVFLKK